MKRWEPVDLVLVVMLIATTAAVYFLATHGYHYTLRGQVRSAYMDKGETILGLEYTTDHRIHSVDIVGYQTQFIVNHGYRIGVDCWGAEERPYNCNLLSYEEVDVQ